MLDKERWADLAEKGDCQEREKWQQYEVTEWRDGLAGWGSGAWEEDRQWPGVGHGLKLIPS